MERDEKKAKLSFLKLALQLKEKLSKESKTIVRHAGETVLECGRETPALNKIAEDSIENFDTYVTNIMGCCISYALLMQTIIKTFDLKDREYLIIGTVLLQSLSQMIAYKYSDYDDERMIMIDRLNKIRTDNGLSIIDTSDGRIKRLRHLAMGDIKKKIPDNYIRKVYKKMM